MPSFNKGFCTPRNTCHDYKHVEIRKFTGLLICCVELMNY